MRSMPEETIDSYRALHVGGRRQFWIRLAIAAFVGLGADWIAPSLVPLIWFIGVAASQLLSAVFLRRFILPPTARLTSLIKVMTVLVMVLASLSYTSIAGYLWFKGPAGQVFATTIMLGSLLHVALYRQAVRPVLMASAASQGLFLFGLPIISGLMMGRPALAGSVVTILAGALYIGHLAASVGQTHRLTASLRSASRSKSAFLATLSHEIRTPLNAVTSAAHLLSRTDLTAEQKEHVSILLTGSEVLLSLINDVLDMSKIEAGKLSAEISDVDLRALTEKLAALWTPKAAERGLKLVVEVAPDLPPAVRSDPLRLNQILFNLLSNAVKFTAEGAVTIRVEAAPGAGPSAAPRLRFSVIDTGPGLSEEVQGRLFQSFEQADAGVALRHGGTGLGLAISRKLAELLEGTLTVSSVLGHGATFVLDLPLAVSDLTAAPGPAVVDATADAEPAAGGRRLSVLLAEDHPVNRRLVELILSPMGWELTVAEDGGEAVSLAMQRPFDVILLDMQMPVLSGIQAAALITGGGGPNAHTPFAALTANAFEDQRAQWEAVGAAAFLTKPLNPGLLIQTIIELATAPGGDRSAGRAAAV